MHIIAILVSLILSVCVHADEARMDYSSISKVSNCTCTVGQGRHPLCFVPTPSTVEAFCDKLVDTVECSFTYDETTKLLKYDQVYQSGFWIVNPNSIKPYISTVHKTMVLDRMVNTKDITKPLEICNNKRQLYLVAEKWSEKLTK